MKITNEWLQEKTACVEGVEWWKGCGETNGKKVVEKLVGADKLDWANWLIVRIMDRPQVIRYSIFAAEQVIDTYEKKYPDDKRPRLAIEATKKVLEADTEENRSAADSAARSAAYSADSAAFQKMQNKILKYGLGLLGDK